MPVMRVSECTWERLKLYARPLEDTVDDVVNRALDALQSIECKSENVSPKTKPPKKSKEKNNMPKLPQKEFRKPLMELLQSLGGGADVATIQNKLEVLMKPSLLPGDYNEVSSGQVRWWNAACWERNELVKAGLFKDNSLRGRWELSDRGIEYLALH